MRPVTESFPEPRPNTRLYARARLRVAIAAETRRRARRRRQARWGVFATGICVLVVGLSPPGDNGETAPLVGLADAVAAAPVPGADSDRHWYSRTESRELMSVSLEDARVLQFLLPAVEELEHAVGDTPRRTVTYGEPTFFSPEDEDAFHAAGLGAVYRAGHQVSTPLAVADFGFADSLPDASSEALASALGRRVAGVENGRPTEVRLLELTAQLIRVHANDPGMRARILRVIADIPGIVVVPDDDSLVVAIDYLDGDRPLRLMYEFDGESAHLVSDSLAVLATQSEPATVLRSARHSLPVPGGVSES